MPTMATALTEFSDNGNSRTYTLTGHTAVKPQIVIQKRVVATAANASAEDTINVVYGTSDADGNPLPGRVSFAITVRRPVQGQASDVTSALAVVRDIVASDEFANTIDTQEYLK